ncbi:MAG: histidine kinase [Lachnospiraceae bacterium]|nr:histidine kinase [Lachnospiraceae bacterium]
MGWLKRLRQYRKLSEFQRNRDLDQLIHTDWEGDPILEPLFEEISKRLNGEENKKLQQKQAEVLALQNQINPHFLYNTLEAIRADALMAECDEIAETTEALATFFRYTISNVQEYVTFSDELDNVENYFTVQRCRFGDKINLELVMENEALLEARMPKLVLQPIVENAVIHGLEGKLGQGTVKIIIENSDKVLFLKIKDNGLGMSDDDVKQLNLELEQGNRASGGKKNKRGGIALRNVNSRIRLMFGDDYGMRIYSKDGVGTECCLTMPLLFEHEVS